MVLCWLIGEIDEWVVHFGESCIGTHRVILLHLHWLVLDDEVEVGQGHIRILTILSSCEGPKGAITHPRNHIGLISHIFY